MKNSVQKKKKKFQTRVSVGERQQGITANVPTLGEGGDFDHKC